MAFKDDFILNTHWAKYINNSFKYKYNFAEGAYRSSKTVSNLVSFALNLETTPDLIHLAIASTVASAKAIIEDGNGLLRIKTIFWM